MALQKPIVEIIAAFDATTQAIIPFRVNGGDQVVSNRAIIKLGSTNETIYDATETTFSLEHTIPANTLTNGNYYTIQIQTFSIDNSSSALSSPITFYCYTQPSFNFTNLPSGNVVINAGYIFNLGYNQIEGEALNSYVINLYNASHTLIWSTNTIYVGANGTPPSNFSAGISGFEDGSLYYIKASGQTEQSTILETDYITLTTIFDSPSIYTQLLLTNNNCEGYVVITSNVVSLDGTSNPSPPIYIDNDEVDLTEEGSYVNWEQSFGVYDISTTRIWLRSINPNVPIATFYNANSPEQAITLYEREITISGVDYVYIEGYYIDDAGLLGYIFTDRIAKPSDSQQLMIWLQKRSGMYDISVSEVTA